MPSDNLTSPNPGRSGWTVTIASLAGDGVIAATCHGLRVIAVDQFTLDRARIPHHRVPLLPGCGRPMLGLDIGQRQGRGERLRPAGIVGTGEGLGVGRTPETTKKGDAPLGFQRFLFEPLACPDQTRDLARAQWSADPPLGFRPSARSDRRAVPVIPFASTVTLGRTLLQVLLYVAQQYRPYN